MIKNIMFSLGVLFAVQNAAALEFPAEIPKLRYRPLNVGNVTYTEKGFRFGYVPKIENTYGYKAEGRMLMGYGSSEAPIFDQLCMDEGGDDLSAAKGEKRDQILGDLRKRCLIDKNPFIFSIVDKDLYNAFLGESGQPNKYKGLPVVVYYVRESLALFGPLTTGALQTLIARTESFVKSIWPVDPTIDMPMSYSEPDPSGFWIESDGFVQGTIVKATLDNLMLKTWEITIQEGIANNAFVRLSINSKKMFDYTVNAMRTGDQVKVRYVRYWPTVGWGASFRGYLTHLRVTAVERIPTNNNLGTLPARNRGQAN